MKFTTLTSIFGKIRGARSFDDARMHYERVLLTRKYAPKTRYTKAIILRHISDDFSGRLLSEIRPFDVATLVNRLTAQDKACTAKQVLTVTRDLFNESILQGWIDINPAIPIKRPRTPVKRCRLTFEQWQAIYESGVRHLPGWFGPLMLLALVTGQRRADLARLGWQDVHDGLLHIEQQKTGARIALPLALRLDALDMTLAQVLERCHSWGADGRTLLRRQNGASLSAGYMSIGFRDARDFAGVTVETGTPPSLHEVRSLSERLYREQGIDTQTLLGHRSKSMTDVYNNDRGLRMEKWKILTLP